MAEVTSEEAGSEDRGKKRKRRSGDRLKRRIGQYLIQMLTEQRFIGTDWRR